MEEGEGDVVLLDCDNLASVRVTVLNGDALRVILLFWCSLGDDLCATVLTGAPRLPRRTSKADLGPFGGGLPFGDGIDKEADADSGAGAGTAALSFASISSSGCGEDIELV